MIEQLAAALGVKQAGLIAGFVGAVVSLRFVTEARTWPARITMALCGTLCAAYLTPALAEYLDASERVENGLAFALGLFGMTLAGAIVSAIRELKVAEQIATWFKRPGA